MESLKLLELFLKVFAFLKNLPRLLWAFFGGRAKSFECKIDKTLIDLCIDFDKSIVSLQESRICELRCWQNSASSRGRVSSRKIAAKDRELRKRMEVEIESRKQKLKFEVKRLLIERGRMCKSTNWADFKLTYAARYDVLNAIEIL